MRKIFTLLTVLVASVCGLTPAKADKATLDEGYYYIINTYEKFASMKAWFYGQVDARQADQYAFLCWDDFSANDPRFIFEVKKGTAENGYILKSMASEFFLSGLSSDSLVAANPDAGTNYYFEEVGSTDDGKTYYIWNDSLVWTRGERSADNRIYPDSHQYGAGNKGHLGGNRWWTLEDNGAAKWLLVKLSDEDLASFSKTKVLLANLVSSINNPNVFGANGADADAYNALKAAWNAADEALKGMETDATYERLYTELNQAKINADDSHVTLKEGIYYIVSTYEKFGDRQAWNYSQAYQNSTKYAGADLYWSSLSTGDLRFMFEIKMMGDGLGYTIMNYASGKYVGGKASGSTMIAMEQEPTVPQYFEETGDGTFYVYNDETGGNMFYCDSHGFGGGRNGNIGCNNWWTLDENAAAKWELVKVTDEELAKISEAKLKLARKVCEIRDPNTSGAGDYDLEKFQALKDAWNAANESLETIESDATYEMLYDDLQAALDAADGSVTEFEPGWYYIESAYEDFAETVAMCQDRIDNTGAELVYEPLVEGDPKFIFYIDRVDAGKVTIQNVASGLYLTQAGEMGWTQHFVRMGEDAAIQMMELGEEGTCQLYLSSYGSNRYFPDSHAFGANTVGHISISNAWGEVPDAALWKLVPVEDDNLYLISDAKLNLYQYLLTEYNPFVMGEDPGYVSADVYDAFNGPTPGPSVPPKTPRPTKRPATNSLPSCKNSANWPTRNSFRSATAACITSSASTTTTPPPSATRPCATLRTQKTPPERSIGLSLKRTILPSSGSSPRRMRQAGMFRTTTRRSTSARPLPTFWALVWKATPSASISTTSDSVNSASVPLRAIPPMPDVSTIRTTRATAATRASTSVATATACRATTRGPYAPMDLN